MGWKLEEKKTRPPHILDGVDVVYPFCRYELFCGVVGAFILLEVPS
jgi:hypothetical protein